MNPQPPYSPQSQTYPQDPLQPLTPPGPQDPLAAAQLESVRRRQRMGQPYMPALQSTQPMDPTVMPQMEDPLGGQRSRPPQVDYQNPGYGGLRYG